MPRGGQSHHSEFSAQPKFEGRMFEACTLEEQKGGLQHNAEFADVLQWDYYWVVGISKMQIFMRKNKAIAKLYLPFMTCTTRAGTPHWTYASSSTSEPRVAPQKRTNGSGRRSADGPMEGSKIAGEFEGPPMGVWACERKGPSPVADDRSSGTPIRSADPRRRAKNNKQKKIKKLLSSGYPAADWPT